MPPPGGRGTRRSPLLPSPLPQRLAPLHLALPTHSLELTLPPVAAARHALRDGCREHLASEEIGEALDRLPQCALVPQHDAIGDIEAGFPPQGVHVMGQLA